MDMIGWSLITCMDRYVIAGLIRDSLDLIRDGLRTTCLDYDL